MTSNVSLPINKLRKRGQKKKLSITQNPEIMKSIARHIDISVTIQSDEAQFF